MAGNNVELFLYYFEKNVKEKVRNNPDMLYKNYRKNKKWLNVIPWAQKKWVRDMPNFSTM